MTENWPQPSPEPPGLGAKKAPRVVEGELVGQPRRPSLLGRVLRRWVLAASSAVLGAVFCVGGILLTATIVGALIGLPLLFLGLALIIAAVWLALGGGEIVVWNSRGRGPGGPR